MLREGEQGYRIPAGCAISGIFSRAGRLSNGSDIIKSIELMHNRSNGLGGGFAAYGIYPELKDFYAFHLFYDTPEDKAACETYLKQNYVIECDEEIPTRQNKHIINEPIIWRYFVKPKEEAVIGAHVDEKQFVIDSVMLINEKMKGAYVFSSGKNMGCFKAVGYPEDVGDFFRLEDYKAYCWTAHGRYPTNTPGWWGGAHPFSLADLSVVHNGEISSYDANRRYIESFGYKCTLSTDTEAIAYILDLLVRRNGLSQEEAAHVIAAPFWSTIDRMKDEKQKELYTYYRCAFAPLLITGPFSILVGSTGQIMALNDRVKLRSMVVGEKDDMVYIASEEAAIRVIQPELDRVFAPRGGEPVIYTLDEGVQI